MVDEGRVTRLLRSVSEQLDRLATAAEVGDADRGPWWLDGVKYLFITTIEGCVDVAHHIASSEGYGPPASNADAVRMLGDRGVVDPDVTQRVARAVGFRNVLVHRYADVDDAVVIAALDRLDDLRSFVREVSGWLLEQPRQH